jgi:hypothetical protein
MKINNRLRGLEVSWVCRRPIDKEMSYNFNRPVHGVTPEQH